MAVDVVARLRLRGEEFSRGMRKAFSGIPAEADKAGRESGARLGSGLSAGLKTGIAGLGIGVIVNEIAQVTGRSLEFAKGIDQVSKATNSGAFELQVYRDAASSLGLVANEADAGLQKLFESVVKSGDATSDQAEAFNRLGISVRDMGGAARPTTAILGDTIDALREIPDPLRQAELGAALFGDQWKTMAPLLAAGGQGFRQLAADIEETTNALSAEEIKALGDINADLNKVKRTLEADISRAVLTNANAVRELSADLADLAVKAINAAGAMASFLSGQDLGGGRVKVRRVISAQRDYLDGYIPTKSPIVYNELGIPIAGGGTGRRQLPKKGRGGGRASAFELKRLGIEDADAPRRRTEAEKAAMGPPVLFTPKPSRGGGGRGGGGARAANDNASREAEKLAREWERITAATAKQLDDTREGAEIEALRAAGLTRQADVQEALGRIASANSQIAGKNAAQIAQEFKVSEEAAAGLVAMLAEMARLAEIEIDLKIDAERLATFERDFADFAEGLGQQASEAIDRAAEAQGRQFEQLADTFYMLFAGGADDFWDHFKRRGQVTLADTAAQLTLGLLSGNKISGKGLGGAVKSLFSANPNDLGSILEKGALGSGVGGMLGLRQSGAGGSIGSLLGGSKMVSGLLNSVMSGLGPFGAALGGLLGGTLGGLVKKTKTGSATLGANQFGELGTASVRGNNARFRDAASSTVNSLGGQLDRIAEMLGGRIDASRASVSVGIRDGKFRVDPTGRGNTKKKRGAIDFGEDEQAAIRFALADAIKDGVISGVSAASTRILQSGQNIEVALEKALMIEELPKKMRARLDPVGAALDELDNKFKKLADVLKEGGASAEQIAQARELWQLERADTLREMGSASKILGEYLKSLRVGPDSPLSLRQQAAEAEKAFAPYEAQIRAAQASRADLDALERRKAAGENISDADIAAARAAVAAAAARIDQAGFRDTAALFLDVKRQLGGSTRVFFDEFERIQGLTNQAISLVENAVPLRGAPKDPFAELTAQSTQAAANILEQQSGMLAQQSELLDRILTQLSSVGSGFAGDPRGFGRAA